MKGDKTPAMVHIKAGGRVFEVRVKPVLKIFGWDLCWLKVRRVPEEQDGNRKANP